MLIFVIRLFVMIHQAVLFDHEIIWGFQPFYGYHNWI